MIATQIKTKTGELAPEKQLRLQISEKNWLYTPDGESRGYIQPHALTELWFHTGTICNLQCSFCLEGAGPGDRRINALKLEDAKPFVDEALMLGVEQFSFTGGEPFVVRDFIKILDYALNYRPCLVLTNATDPLISRMADVEKFQDKPHPLSFRTSLDHPDPKKHDAGRGQGNFAKTLSTLAQLHRTGFSVSIARHRTSGEDRQKVDRAYRPFFSSAGLPEDLNIISFPEFMRPGAIDNVPHITENCMRKHKDENARAEFMCSFSKMVLKKGGKMCVYACTLVDDDIDYDLGSTLSTAMRARIMLKHHRCYRCFAHGASCSELK